MLRFLFAVASIDCGPCPEACSLNICLTRLLGPNNDRNPTPLISRSLPYSPIGPCKQLAVHSFIRQTLIDNVLSEGTVRAALISTAQECFSITSLSAGWIPLISHPQSLLSVASNFYGSLLPNMVLLFLDLGRRRTFMAALSD